MAFDELDREEWHITDDSGAEWALQRIAEEQAEFERLKNLGEKQIEEQQIGLENLVANAVSISNESNNFRAVLFEA